MSLYCTMVSRATVTSESFKSRVFWVSVLFPILMSEVLQTSDMTRVEMDIIY